MTGRIVWHRVAEEDLTQAYLRIGADSPRAAERLLDAVEESLELLLRNPAAGRRREFLSPAAQGIRSWPVRGFRVYLLFYRTAGQGIEVVRMLHAARDQSSQWGGDS